MKPRHKSGRFAKSQKEVDRREQASSRLSAFNKLSNVNNTLAETPCDSSVSDNLGSVSVSASDCDDVNERLKYIEQAVQSVRVEPMTTPTAPKVQGRRIVELDTLSVALENGCISCHTPLKLINITHERRYGYTSGLYIR